MVNAPPVEGIREIVGRVNCWAESWGEGGERGVEENVERSSCAKYAALNIHLHCVQYWIVTCGYLTPGGPGAGAEAIAVECEPSPMSAILFSLGEGYSIYVWC